jgi:phosphoribosylaminoimidazole-succinocarboxamide synthase|tara:strand:- start:4 stop:1116 length:1113 start_codon:yes stop_codon:yes gene_type:complete
MDFLDKQQALEIVENYMASEGRPGTTQEILDSNAVPRLNGYKVKPGKVSDSIFGGKFTYTDKASGEEVEWENPPLDTASGIPIRIMVRTEKISTHDMNRGEIPYKDQLLALNHATHRKILEPYFGNSQFDVGLPDNSVVIAAENTEIIPVENVMRAYMAKSSTKTSLYVAFMDGKREFCGHILPKNLITNGPLPYIMDTPSTKSDEHDKSVSPQQLFDQHICTPAEYNQIRNAGIAAFGAISHALDRKGLIAVDTKTEHGRKQDGTIAVIDEIWTMDSSRFWLKEDYLEQMRKLEAGEIEFLNPRSFSKEFARGFSEGDKGYTDEQRRDIAVRYIEGVQQLLENEFNPDQRLRDERVVHGLHTIVNKLAA